MGSPVTLTGFNKIDFGAILDVVMTQERQPIVELQGQQQALQSRAGTYRTLAGHLSTFQTALDALVGNSTLGTKVSNSDSAALTVSSTATTALGSYSVSVQSLARAQVTASTSFPPDPDQTVVARGGTITIGGVTVSIDAPVTLKELADRINSTANIPVTATVIKAATNSWQLVLTGKATGLANAFSVQNNLEGDPLPQGGFTPPGVTFGGNAVAAADAQLLINNVPVTRSSNTVDEAIPGATLTLLKETTSPVQLAVTEDVGGLRSKVEKLVDSFNSLVKFAEDQRSSAAARDKASIGRDPLLRGLMTTLRAQIGGQYSAAGDPNSLAAIGIEFDRSGRLKLTASRFDEAVTKNRAGVQMLLTGQGADQGVFRLVQQTIKSYAATDGLLRSVQDRLTEQSSSLGRRILDLEQRLAVRREALQKEYMAADMAMSRMNSDMSSLSAIGNQYRLF